MSLFQFEHGYGDQRTLAKAPWRKQENLLAIGQVADEPGEVVGAVDKIRIVDDFSEDKRVFLHDYANKRNAK
jgi:hypothetical protein